VVDLDDCGPLALVGSGEYLPAMQQLEAELLAGRPPRYVQIPTAAAEEGEASLAYWVALGQEQAERIGVEAVPLVVRDRAEADDPQVAARVAGAGLVYLSGGSPSYLARTLRGTRLWEAVVAAWRDGAALAGCSAGAMALTGWAPYVREPDREPEAGLGVLERWKVLPHFDFLTTWDPNVLPRTRAELAPGEVLVGIDEETALVRSGGAWRVHGRQEVHVFAPQEGRYAGGELVPL
jgi:cyanophycinase-like exopeptidase